MRLFMQTGNQRGDTLVEVTVALAIMASVLTSAFLITERATTMGRVAKERSQMVSTAQQQAEILTAYRDRVSWSAFKSSISTALATSGCPSSGSCFTIDPLTMTLQPGAGNVAEVPTSVLAIKTNILDPTNPNPATFVIEYEAEPSGGGEKMKSQVILQLGDTGSLRSRVVVP